MIKKILKIFNPHSARASSQNKDKFDKLKVSAMIAEIENNPKFVQFLIDNLEYSIKIIDIQTLATDIKVDVLYSLLGEKRGYVRLHELLTKKIEVEYKD